MWCSHCHYGSPCYRPTAQRCPQCGYATSESLVKRPFPEKPKGKGSGKPTTGRAAKVQRS